MLAGLRQHAARNVGRWGTTPPGLAPVAAGSGGGVERGGGAWAAAPPHSATNDDVLGADEPDLVKTDGSRVITVERGVLRVVDAATRTVTARLKLVSQQAWGASNLLVEGNRALVIFAGRGVMASGGAVTPGPYPEPINEETEVRAGGPVRVAEGPGHLTPSGDYVDARLAAQPRGSWCAASRTSQFRSRAVAAMTRSNSRRPALLCDGHRSPLGYRNTNWAMRTGRSRRAPCRAAA